MNMRPRRRRPRGPGPRPQPTSGGGEPGSGAPAAGYPQNRTGQNLQRRRRRRRGGNRPVSNNGSQPYASAPQPMQGGPRMQGGGPQQRRRRRMRGPGERSRGLEILKDMQQAGAALDPTERLQLELPPGKGSPPYGDRITGRALDLIAPLGRGQRCLIVSPPKAGKTRILQSIAASVAFNHPEVLIHALLVDERPEEVTDFRRNTPANVIAASSDMTIEEHVDTAEHAIETVAAKVLEG